MRMNAAKMHKVAEYAIKHGITKAAKRFLTMDGNKMVDYSFKENLQICRRAVIQAVKWSRTIRTKAMIKHLRHD